MCQVFGLASLEVSGYEADDLIGSLSWRAVDDGMAVVIVSADKVTSPHAPGQGWQWCTGGSCSHGMKETPAQGIVGGAGSADIVGP